MTKLFLSTINFISNSNFAIISKEWREDINIAPTSSTNQ